MSKANLVKDTIEQIISDHVDLPSPPQVVIQIEKALTGGQHGLEYLTKLILFDPALTARLIKLANSPLYGAAGGITTVRDAVVRIGLNATKNVTLLMLVQNSFRAQNPVIASYMSDVWEESVDIAAVSAAIAKRTPPFSIDRAMLAGLLQNIGSMLLLTRLDSVLKNLKYPKTLEIICEAHGKKLGAMLMRHWGLDAELIEVVESRGDWYRDKREEASLADLVVVARLHSLAASGDGHKYPGICAVPAYEKLAELSFQSDESLAILNEAQNEIHQVKQLLTSH